jgi:hypothetical protein
MALRSEKEKLVRSIARFLAGFKPRSRVYGYRESVHYFLKYRMPVVKKVLELKEKTDGKTCPFCKARFKKSATLVHHLIAIHSKDILSYVEAD